MSVENAAAEITDEDLAKFDWLDLQRDMDRVLPQETKLEKLFRKCKENPFVPIGTVATSAALIYGIWNFRHGKKKMSQYMMRTRVAAQGFTIVAIVMGYVLGIDKIEKK